MGFCTPDQYRRFLHQAPIFERMLLEDGILLRNLGGINYFRGHESLRLIGDFSLNVANPITASILMEQGLECVTISYDLNITQVIDLLKATPYSWMELTLHQHIPMFHMEHCVFCAFMSTGTDSTNCGRPCEKHKVHLRDRVGKKTRVKELLGDKVRQSRDVEKVRRRAAAAAAADAAAAAETPDEAAE